MKKFLLLLLIVLMLFNLGGCGEKSLGNPHNNNNNNSESSNNSSDNNYDDETLDYLVANWKYESFGLSNMGCTLEIKDDKKVEISIYNSLEDRKETHAGTIEISEDKKIISFNIEGKSYEYGFQHMTLYDGKYLMALYHSGETHHILEGLIDEDRRDTIDEIFFEREADISLTSSPKKASKFNGVIWGYKLDGATDKFWIGELDEDFNIKNGISNLYAFSDKLDEDLKSLYYDDMFIAYAYVFETDENGDIISMSMEGYRHYLTGGQPK